MKDNKVKTKKEKKQRTDEELERFLQAQERGYHGNSNYETALNEVKNGNKTSHWVWYIFPQIKGLIANPSAINSYFSLPNLRVTKKYLQNDVLYQRYYNIVKELNKHERKDLNEIFASDRRKVISSLTLFAIAAKSLKNSPKQNDLALGVWH